jgi:ubiquinone/menaquinone biosynthesis C-methylase UbiE
MRSSTAKTSWDPVADWYAGWVGKQGSKHHRAYAIPAVLELLDPQPGEMILDLGAGPGVLAPAITAAQADYTGVDISTRMLRYARKRHGDKGRFIQADARNLALTSPFQPRSFDAVVFLFSIQDIEPFDAALASAAWALKPGGRVVLLMTHPCFRVPRQSGWEWDQQRKLQFRRIDRYLTPLAVPMKEYARQGHGATRSFHRPLASYINGLAACELLLDRMLEISGGTPAGAKPRTQAEARAIQEIPLFLGLRARRYPNR